MKYELVYNLSNHMVLLILYTCHAQALQVINSATRETSAQLNTFQFDAYHINLQSCLPSRALIMLRYWPMSCIISDLLFWN